MFDKAKRDGAVQAASPQLAGVLHSMEGAARILNVSLSDAVRELQNESGVLGPGSLLDTIKEREDAMKIPRVPGEVLERVRIRLANRKPAA